MAAETAERARTAAIPSAAGRPGGWLPRRWLHDPRDARRAREIRGDRRGAPPDSHPVCARVALVTAALRQGLAPDARLPWQASQFSRWVEKTCGCSCGAALKFHAKSSKQVSLTVDTLTPPSCPPPPSFPSLLLPWHARTARAVCETHTAVPVPRRARGFRSLLPLSFAGRCRGDLVGAVRGRLRHTRTAAHLCITSSR